MLAALANLAIRNPRRTTLLALVVLVVAGVFGATAIDDDAAYLGRELSRAGHALRSGGRYELDAAPG